MNFSVKKKGSRLLAALLAAVMVLTLTSCGGNEPSQESSESMVESSGSVSSSGSSSSSSASGSSSSSSGSDSSSSGSSSASASEDTRTPAEIQKEILAGIVEYHKLNEDTVGWLYVPGTTINESVVQTVDNDYYLRRTNLGKQNYDGCYYVDFRGTLGSRDTLSKNTVIYGHSMNDDPNGGRFSQLKKYLDLNFAKEHPYIYFSTPESDMVWQVFAVFYTEKYFNYNDPNPSAADFINIINDARQRSQFNFDTTVGANDKILTLSTCTYVYDAGYPNDYRYVVMAKLMDKNAEQTTVTVEKNPSPKAPSTK